LTDSNKTLQAKIHPFLKWAGGKRWLVQGHLNLFPKEFNNYYEPFLGSGAVFFALKPKQGILSDINPNLVECYQAIKTDWKAVETILKKHHKFHCSDYYYKIRSSKPRTLFSKAARFIYLNRTCWNGLYRVNKKGEFNVPIGTKQNVVLGTDNFKETSRLLHNFRIDNKDFKEVIIKAKKNDFVFVDPPYTIKHNKNNFVKYNEELFHWDEQISLRDAVVKASQKGVHIMVTNANHPAVRKLYRGHFKIKKLKRKSVIASSAENRGVYEEIIMRNWL
jgi:DNA adenine methylase